MSLDNWIDKAETAVIDKKWLKERLEEQSASQFIQSIRQEEELEDQLAIQVSSQAFDRLFPKNAFNTISLPIFEEAEKAKVEKSFPLPVVEPIETTAAVAETVEIETAPVLPPEPIPVSEAIDLKPVVVIDNSIIQAVATVLSILPEIKFAEKKQPLSKTIESEDDVLKDTVEIKAIETEQTEVDVIDEQTKNIFLVTKKSSAFLHWLHEVTDKGDHNFQVVGPEIIEGPIVIKKKKKKRKKKKKKGKIEKESLQHLVDDSVELNDDIYSEALAQLLEKQGYKEKATKMYQQLSLTFPEKSAYFAAKIEELNKK